MSAIEAQYYLDLMGSGKFAVEKLVKYHVGSLPLLLTVLCSERFLLREYIRIVLMFCDPCFCGKYSPKCELKAFNSNRRKSIKGNLYHPFTYCNV